MNSDHITAGVGSGSSVGAFTTLFHYHLSLPVEIAGAYAVLSLLIGGVFWGIFQWLYKIPPIESN